MAGLFGPHPSSTRPRRAYLGALNEFRASTCSNWSTTCSTSPSWAPVAGAGAGPDRHRAAAAGVAELFSPARPRRRRRDRLGGGRPAADGDGRRRAAAPDSVQLGRQRGEDDLGRRGADHRRAARRDGAAGHPALHRRRHGAGPRGRGPGAASSRSSSRPRPAIKAGGAGLGLAIVKRLAEAFGGRVGVDSQPGQGARFWFEAGFALAPVQDMLPSPLKGLVVAVASAQAMVREAALLQIRASGGRAQLYDSLDAAARRAPSRGGDPGRSRSTSPRRSRPRTDRRCLGAGEARRARGGRAVPSRRATPAG